MRNRCASSLWAGTVFALLGGSLSASVYAISTDRSRDEIVKAYIDADTANEVDDGFAILRALVAPELKVLGVSSAGFGREDSFGEGTKRSQRMNEEILGHLRLKHAIAHPLGARAPMPDAHTPTDSPAARDLIKKAHSMPEGVKLRVYILGPYTNIASALLIEPAIEKKVVVFLIGPTLRDGKLVGDDPNSMGDLQAWNYLQRSEVELHVMPATTLMEGRRFDYALKGIGPKDRLNENTWPDFVFYRRDLNSYFSGRGGVRDYLSRRWASVADESFKEAPEFMAHYSEVVHVDQGEWMMWDVALIEASLHPEWTKDSYVSTPGRAVRVWTEVDKFAMERDFWLTTQGDPINYGTR